MASPQSDRTEQSEQPALPEDEQLLYASWQLVPRTLYEVVSVSAGERSTVLSPRLLCTYRT